eukprot:gi/632946968/ref/XP_007888823.1/ PREDICTED: uncharacterized protein KIAA2012 homolog [Callorhinchus milii]
MASFWTQATNAKAPATGIVRGSLPQILRDAHKGSSVGSLIMGPDGQVVQLSLLGSIRGPGDTSQIVSTGTQEDKQQHSGLTQEEPWADSMQDLEADAKACGDNVAPNLCRAPELPNSDKGCERKVLRKNGSRPVILDGDTSGALGEDQKASLLLQSHQSSHSNEGNAEGSPEEVKDAVEGFSEGMSNPLYTPTGSTHTTVSRISSPLSPVYSPASSPTGSIYSKTDPFSTLIEPIDPPAGQSQGEAGKSSANALEVSPTLHEVNGSSDRCVQPPSQKSSQRVKDQVTAVEGWTDTSSQDKVVDSKDQPGKRTTDISATKKDYGGHKTMKKGIKDWDTPNKSSAVNKLPRQPREIENKKRNDRVQFVVGKPKGKRMQKQYLLNIKKQKKSSKNVSRELDVPQEEDDENGKSMPRSSDVDGLLDSSDQIDSPTTSANLMSLLFDQCSISQIAVDMPHTTVPAMGSTTAPTLVKSEKVAKPQAEKSSVKGEKKKNISSAEEQKLREQKLREQKLREQKRKEQEQREQQQREQQREQEQLERQERIKKELGDDLQKRKDKIRLQKLQQEEERSQLEAEQKSQQNQEQRERKQQEQYKRKLQEMQQQKQRDVTERAVEAERRRSAEDAWLVEEQQRQMEMSEPDHLEYLRKKREDENWMQEQQVESWKGEEETTRLMMENAKQEAMMLTHQRALMDHQLQFNRNLIVESNGLERMHDITRPWVFSYFGLKKIVDVQPSPEE